MIPKWALERYKVVMWVRPEVQLVKNSCPVPSKLELGDLTPLQCRYDFGHQTLVGTAEGSTVSFKSETFSI